MTTRLMTLIILILLPPVLAAAEFTYNARVVSTEPVTHTRRSASPPAACFTARPAAFGDQLSWDITCAQPHLVAETAYRVRYEVSGQLFTTTLASLPGETLPVRLQLR